MTLPVLQSVHYLRRAVALIVPFLIGLRAAARDAEQLDFQRVIRPILAEHCFQCHGPDEAARQAGLRQDNREAMILPRELGVTAVVASSPEESEVVRRIASADLDDTLIVWGGEFGRTPMIQGGEGTYDGRDHHNRCYTVWLAGGGVKQGHVHGETDELGFKVAHDPVHVHDLNATLLHLLGIDHTKLTHRFQGRDFRLTDVHGEVVEGILA